jgi:hypothetical protein
MKKSIGSGIVLLAALIAFGMTPRPAEAASKTLFEDKFQRTDLGTDAWEIHDCTHPAEGPSKWFIKNKALIQTSNIYRSGPDEYVFFEGTNIVTMKGSDWTDYEFTVNFSIAGDNDGVGFLFRYQDEEHYYRFIMVDDPGNHGPFQKLQVKNGDAFTTLAENKAGYKEKGNNAVRIVVVGSKIEVFLDKKSILKADDPTYTSGRIGMMSYAEQPIFDDVKVVSK